jgi:hypothetical protein
MDFKELIAKMIKQLSKADKHIEKAKVCEDKELVKIYHKMAQDKYDNFMMFHNLMGHKAKEYMGENFDTEDKMYKIVHCILDNWATDVKEELDKMKIM